MGLKIKIDPKNAAIALQSLRKDFNGLATGAKLSEKQMKKLEKRFIKGLEAKKGKDALDKFQKSAKLTRMEMARLHLGLGNFSGAMGIASGKIKSMAKNIFSLQGAMTALAAALSFKFVLDRFETYEVALKDLVKVTDENLGTIEKRLQELPKKLGSGTEKLQAYYQVVSAGVTDIAKSTEVLIDTARVSKVAHISQADVIKGVTSLLDAYAGSMKNSTEAADLLFQMEAKGKTTVKELIPVIGGLANLSASLGISFDEMGASMAQVTQFAGNTSEAATQYQAILTALISPQKEMITLLKEYGSVQDAIKKIGFVNVVKKIAEASSKGGVLQTDLLKKLLGGRKEATIGMLALIKNDFAGLEDRMESMANKTGKLDKAWEAWEVTLQATRTVFNNTIGSFFREFGQELAPDVQRNLEEMSEWLGTNKPQIMDAFDDISTLVGSIGELSIKSTSFFADVLKFYNQLPDVVKEIGILGLVFGGKKLRMVMAAITLGAVVIKDLGKLSELADEDLVSYKTLLTMHGKDLDEFMKRLEKDPTLTLLVQRRKEMQEEIKEIKELPTGMEYTPAFYDTQRSKMGEENISWLKKYVGGITTQKNKMEGLQRDLGLINNAIFDQWRENDYSTIVKESPDKAQVFFHEMGEENIAWMEKMGDAWLAFSDVTDVPIVKINKGIQTWKTSVEDFNKEIKGLEKNFARLVKGMTPPPKSTWNMMQEISPIGETPEEERLRTDAMNEQLRRERMRRSSGFAQKDMKKAYEQMHGGPEMDAALAENKEKNQYQLKETIKTLEKLEELTEDAAQIMRGTMSDIFFSGMTDGFNSLKDVAQSTLNAIARMTADFMADMVAEVLRDIAKAGLSALKQFAITIGSSIIGSFGSSGTSSGGGYTGPKAGSPTTVGNVNVGAPFHRGGVVGVTPTILRNVSPLVFENAPRLHSGLRKGEYPAILEKGEEVIPADKQSGGMTVNLTIMALDSKSFVEFTNRNPGAIINPINKALSRGDSNLINNIQMAAGKR